MQVQAECATASTSKLDVCPQCGERLDQGEIKLLSRTIGIASASTSDLMFNESPILRSSYVPFMSWFRRRVHWPGWLCRKCGLVLISFGKRGG
jgi:hypothetical protein